MRHVRLRKLLRASMLGILGLGGVMGDGPMVPPGAPPVPPARLSGLKDYEKVQNQEAAEFLYSRKLISAEKRGDDYYFAPEAPADTKAMELAVRTLLPDFHWEPAPTTRDQAVGACYTAMQEQGLLLLENSISCDSYTIPIGTYIAGRPGKQVTLTVDGIETRMEPGRTYTGDVRLTVTDAYEITHMFDVYQGRTGLCIQNGVESPASCLAAIRSGTVSPAKAEQLVMESQNDYFNPIVIDGGSYTLKDPHLTLNGHGGDDFAGYGAGIMVTGDSQVVIDGGEIDTVGSIRTAVWLGGHSKTLVKNMRITGHDGPTTDFPVAVMNEVPWPLGLKGNLRTTNLLEWAEGTYLNCQVSCENWGVLSTDGSWRGSSLTCINTDAAITGESGYGAYCDMGVEDYFYGTRITVPDYGVVIGGGFCGSTFGPASRENTGELYSELPEEARDTPTVIRAGKHAVMIHSNQGGHCTLEPGTEFHSGRACIMVKTKKGKEVTTSISCDGAKLHSDSGILLQLMESDDAGSPSAAGFVIEAPAPQKTGLDVTDPTDKNTLHVQLKNQILTGDILNSHWSGGQNLCIHLEHTSLTGAVTAGVQHHVNVAPGETITKEMYQEIGNIAVEPAPVTASGVILILAQSSHWTPVGTSYLSRLELKDSSTIAGNVTIDDRKIVPEAGHTYCGPIIVTPFEK